ncbi:MAG: cytochrome c [Planctomycetes bacterium]|nr:cytochrome c [Planctomycetota bacterium]
MIPPALIARTRAVKSPRRRIHLIQDMDNQPKFRAQHPNDLFADGRAMRPPVFGTVARGMLKEDTRFFKGQEADGSYVQDIPVPITREFVLRGRERYNIYCAVCHGKAGDGEGIVMAGGYGFARIGYHNNRLRQIENGYLYDVIANGVRTMPAYGQQIEGARGDADWPAYRHDSTRSGFTAAKISTALQPAWQTKLGGRLSSVVIAALIGHALSGMRRKPPPLGAV